MLRSIDLRKERIVFLALKELRENKISDKHETTSGVMFVVVIVYEPSFLFSCLLSLFMLFSV